MKFDFKSLLSGSTTGKRQQIDNARKQVVMWLSFAGCAVVVTAIVGWNFWNKIVYQTKVNNEINETEDILSHNVSKISKIKSNVDALKADESLNLTQIKADNKAPLQVILDALPTKNDSTSLGSSLQDRVLSRSGATIQSIEIDDHDNLGGKVSVSSSTGKTLGLAAKPVHFAITLAGTAHDIQNTLRDIENSIRTIVVNDIQFDGSDNRMNARISATTYYSPKVNYKLTKKEVKP